MEHELLYVFGTGNAQAVKYYNTCFAIRDGQEYFMVDAGGGNGILKILADMDVSLTDIRSIFVTHAHTDHILGIVWLIRMLSSKIRQGEYEGNVHLYCHGELVETLKTLCHLTIQEKFYKLLDKRILLIPVADGETKQILGHDVTFFDIHSTKARQYGFTILLKNRQKLTCAGDEPYNPACEAYVAGSDWLLHEAFCLYSEREIWKPYEKSHSTVKEACKLAEAMQIPNLVLWHTEDSHADKRGPLYLQEGRLYYHGNLFIPDDKSVLTLC
ncbi:MAG: MBL fold metallo-hydrolase [Lachnospiraceae bacterium]|nr:MBL fold metallo-hydrolase [Lachnospiraceae bacterium]